jgi:hypothetical protein
LRWRGSWSGFSGPLCRRSRRHQPPHESSVRRCPVARQEDARIRYRVCHVWRNPRF